MATAATAMPVHLPHIAPCPFLPGVVEPLSAGCLADFENDRGPDFYLTALRYGQSLWLQGFPARALLLLNRALGSGLRGDEPVLTTWPLPYRAAAWILANHQTDQFIGNPRRHWQHLATRMVEPRKDLRTWRAWACWHIARLLLPDCPADDLQIAREGVIEPAEETIVAQLGRFGHPGEVDGWRETLAWCRAGG